MERGGGTGGKERGSFPRGSFRRESRVMFQGGKRMRGAGKGERERRGVRGRGRLCSGRGEVLSKEDVFKGEGVGGVQKWCCVQREGRGSKREEGEVVVVFGQKRRGGGGCGVQGMWEERSRPGCQGPQRQYAGYLSTTSRKLKMSGSRNSKVIREMIRKEMK